MSIKIKKNIFFILLIILIFISVAFALFIKNKKTIDNFENRPVRNANIKSTPVKKKETYIPLNIFQTWRTLDLPQRMSENVNKLKSDNPEFNYYLYDDAMCRNFIVENFSAEVAKTYDRLIPGAYKADLWRCCILYKMGGIYLDIKFRCVNNFKLIELTNSEHYVKDRDGFFVFNSIGLYNAVMINKPNNPLLMDYINEIVNNVKNNFYGINALYPTGPGLFGDLYMKNKQRYNLRDIDMHNNSDGVTISYLDRTILEHYPEYRNEQVNNSDKPHYYALWAAKSIYVL